MAVPYFQKFPVIPYTVATTGENRAVVDIMQRAKIRMDLESNALIFYEYDVKDGETPEIIAAKLYGWSGYHWIVLFANNIVDPYYDWPMSYNDLIATIRKTYGTPQQDGLIYAYSTVYQYLDSKGNVIDETTFLSLPGNERSELSLYDWLIQQNEDKRHIRLLDTSFVDQIDAELDNLMEEATV